ncbi:conjugative transposon protein TraK [Segetibacter sp. 3557_3]|uniref:conjugative transposon protein TraK n=1 Tax=Segetibacter sp. 3557_3 TaxID=2547429 RepID=UPI0010590A69|nr:conjugative transposon protein TraK [Segetibacter sp. 3557_3]TDH18043.1 conjugative transposon protein TraK [Segetibacter sp. 3557_3]
MFRRAKNIDSAFRSIRLFTVLVVLSCIVICCVVITKSFQLAALSQSRIYILANGKALEAFASERKDNIPVEAKDHIKTFHHLFFTLDPDEKVIKSNLSKALYLADGSAKVQYESLKENGYFSEVIASNISQQITIDSIQFDFDSYPFYFRCFGLQKIIRPSTVVSRSLITEGYLRNVSRSENNSHAFLIERWRTTENRDIDVSNR